jgi:hypothetical protein
MGRIGLLVAVLFILVAAGCSPDRHRVLEPPPPSIPSLTVAELLAAPDSLRVDGMTLTTEVYAYRDWMADPDSGTGVIAFVHLNGNPKGTLPSSIDAVYIWVVNGSEVWSQAMADLGIDAGRTDSSHLFRAQYGPRWDGTVDVVIGVRTSPTEVSLVLLKDVTINVVLLKDVPSSNSSS